MRARWRSFTMLESSEPAETWAIIPSNSAATGLDIPAWKRGFCRRIAAVSVEPARGRPEMKWKLRTGGDGNPGPHGDGWMASQFSPRQPAGCLQNFTRDREDGTLLNPARLVPYSVSLTKC